MNKIIMTIGAIAILTQATFAATSGTLTLTGTVSGLIDIVVTPEPVASTLDLSVTQSNLKVASVTERSNKAAGYTVTVSSANAVAASAAVATLASANSGTLEYFMKYGGSTVTLAGGMATITDATGATSSNGVSKDLTVSYTGDSGLAEGIYTDTLTFTIAAK